jgi:hypothetical protein
MKSSVWPSLVFLVAGPVAAAAREGQPRAGAGISYGPAIVAGSISCGSCGDDGFAGAGGYLRVGHYIRPDLLLAVEVDLHTFPMAYTRFDTHFLSVAMQWYPEVNEGFHIKGSLGIAKLVEVDGEDDGTQRRTLTAPALGISAGYDFRTRHRFLLTPFAGITRLVSGDYKSSGSTTRTASANIFQIGVGFTWY